MSGFLGGGIGPRAIGGASAAASNGLLNGLVAYWPLNEAGGANNALDLHTGALTLTQNSSPGSDTGKVYAGARTMADPADVFTRASETALQIGAGDWAVALWVYFSWESSTGNWIINKRDLAASTIEYQVLRSTASDKVLFFVGNGTDYFGVESAGTVALNEWHFVAAWIDSAAKTINLSLNGAAPQSAAYTGTPLSSTNTAYVGNPWNGNVALAHIGRIGPVAMWKNRTLDAAARAALWNGGAGLAYADFTS